MPKKFTKRVKVRKTKRYPPLFEVRKMWRRFKKNRNAQYALVIVAFIATWFWDPTLVPKVGSTTLAGLDYLIEFLKQLYTRLDELLFVILAIVALWLGIFHKKKE